MKLSKKRFEDLKETLQLRDNAITSIGNLEVKKAQAISQAYEHGNKFETLRLELQAKYGKDVQIDMTTGEVVNASNNLKKA